MKSRKLAPIAVIALLVFSIACKDEQIRKAARASDDMAVTIGLAIDAKRALATSSPPLIDQQEEIALTLGLQKVNTSVRAFHTEVVRLSKVDPQSKGQLLALFTNITQSVSELNNQGVLGIKNEQSKIKLQTILAALNTAIATISAIVGA